MPTKKTPTKKTAAGTAKTAGGVSNNSFTGDFEQLEEILTRSTPTPAGMRIIALTLAAWVEYYGLFKYEDWCEALKTTPAADILDSLTALNTAYHRIVDHRKTLNPMHQYLYDAMLDANYAKAEDAAASLAFGDDMCGTVREIFRDKLTADDLNEDVTAMRERMTEKRSA